LILRSNTISVIVGHVVLDTILRKIISMEKTCNIRGKGRR
jgi:hypothetical protein